MSNRSAVPFLIMVFFGVLVSASGLSVRVIQGGVPIASPRELIEEGIRLGNSELLRKAWGSYEQAVKLEPNVIDGYMQLGRIYFHLSMMGVATDDEFQKVRNYARQALSKSPEIADSHHLMGMVLSGKGSYLDAIDELRLALNLKPGNEFILCDMAAIHLALHQPEESINILEGKKLKDGWSYFILSLAWLQKGAKGRALLNLNKAKNVGFSGYWLDKTLSALEKDLGIPLKLH